MAVPETEDILGMRPRYLLRSGYAGLQFDNATEEKVGIIIFCFFTLHNKVGKNFLNKYDL